jgi:hypothetical protein
MGGIHHAPVAPRVDRHHPRARTARCASEPAACLALRRAYVRGAPALARHADLSAYRSTPRSRRRHCQRTAHRCFMGSSGDILVGSVEPPALNRRLADPRPSRASNSVAPVFLERAGGQDARAPRRAGRPRTRRITLQFSTTPPRSSSRRSSQAHSSGVRRTSSAARLAANSSGVRHPTSA